MMSRGDDLPNTFGQGKMARRYDSQRGFPRNKVLLTEHDLRRARPSTTTVQSGNMRRPGDSSGGTARPGVECMLELVARLQRDLGHYVGMTALGLQSLGAGHGGPFGDLDVVANRDGNGTTRRRLRIEPSASSATSDNCSSPGAFDTS